MLALSLRISSEIPLETDWLAPDRLQGKSDNEIAALPIYQGNRLHGLSDFFEIRGSIDDETLEIDGDCSSLKGIGRQMKSGRLRVYGNTGMHLGAEMAGGEIEVFGNASDWVGAEMKEGKIQIHGHAGNNLGAGYRGSVKGMRGGMILVEGHAGNEVGSQMRRGIIAVSGNVGDFAGIGMIAGTLLVAGSMGQHPGVGMKRGSIITLSQLGSLPPSFRQDCDYHPVFLRLYFRQLREAGFPLIEGVEQLPFRRWSGDLLTIGKGEILERIS